MSAISYSVTSSELDALEVAMMIETEGRAWAVRSDLVSVLAGLHGCTAAAENLAELHSRAPKPRTTSSGVAVVPLKGVLMPQMGLLSLLLGGGGGLPEFKQNLRAAAADPEVSSIVLDVDSPGGLVDQIPETAAMMREVRKTKPIVAVANTQAASAAYWLASQANEVVVTPSGEAGSVGVYQIHKDISQAMESAGVKPTIVKAGTYKTDGNPYEPLTDDARQSAQQAVDDYYDMFVKDVALGRGVEPQEVADGYGQGRSLLAKRAVSSGLADRVATLDQTVSRLAGGRSRIRQTAEDESSETVAETVSTLVYSPEERHRLAELRGRLAVTHSHK